MPGMGLNALSIGNQTIALCIDARLLDDVSLFMRFKKSPSVFVC